MLEEHTPHGIGIHAVILTEPNDELCEKLRSFLEEMGYVGFSNFDLKYDQRDGKFKAFELNARQGRSNYYVTGAGHNLARLLVEDRVEHKNLERLVTRNRSLWMVVPRKVAFAYTPKRYHQEMRALIRAGAVTNPLLYRPDTALKRRLKLAKNQLGHFVKFKKYYHRPDEAHGPDKRSASRP